MGCSTSKLDNEEAVQLCKRRNKFMKQAIVYRLQFASGHMAYIHSMKRVSAALREYIEGRDEPKEFLLDSLPPMKRLGPGGFIAIKSPRSFPVKSIQSAPNSTIHINHMRSGGNPSVSVQERPQSPEIARMETYSSPVSQYGMGGFFGMQSSPINFFHYSPDNRSNFPPPSPQTSLWDFFWNPFSSLDYNGYSTRNSMDHFVLGDEIDGIRRVREEEGIPELEEETEQEETYSRINMNEGRAKFEVKHAKEEVAVEDEDDDDDDDNVYEDADSGTGDTEHEVSEVKSHGSPSMEVSKADNAAQVSNQRMVVDDKETREETPGFTVFLNQRPTSMAEVIKDLETQFMIACSSANEVSAILEATRAQYSTTSNELSAMKMLNPMALLRSTSSRSSSSRFLVNPSNLRDESYERTSGFSEETCSFLGGHQSTLDRLYAWEKKLYQEVRTAERVRIAYEKKCAKLKRLDVMGGDPSSVDKTRAAIRDLHTQLKVSIHSIEVVSMRIEALRDEELQPQLVELIQGLARMWKVMAKCHKAQTCTLDEAKLLLAGMPSKVSRKMTHAILPPSEPHRLACSIANLEMELRNWRVCFESWITSQRSYVQALTGWILSCIHSDSDTSKPPSSPRRSLSPPPIFSLSIHWSRFLDAVSVAPVLDGLDFFAAGIGSFYAKLLQGDSRQTPGGSKRFGGRLDSELGGSKRFGGRLHSESGVNMEMMQAWQLEKEFMTLEKINDVSIKVLCAGMSVAMNSMADFAFRSAEGYADLVKQWENRKRPQILGQTGV